MNARVRIALAFTPSVFLLVVGILVLATTPYRTPITCTCTPGPNGTCEYPPCPSGYVIHPWGFFLLIAAGFAALFAFLYYLGQKRKGEYQRDTTETR